MNGNSDPQMNSRSFASDGVASSTFYRNHHLGLEWHVIFGHFTNNKGRLLDIGCGYGRTTVPLAALGYDVTGIDVVDRMIQVAREENPLLKYFVMDATSLDFPDNHFDYVLFSFNGVDFIQPEEKRLTAFREIHRVLKPGGTFAFSSHNWLPYLCSPSRWASGMIFRLLKSGSIAKRQYACGVEGAPLQCYISTPLRTIPDLYKTGFRHLRVLPGKRMMLMRLFGEVFSVPLVLLLDIWPYYIVHKNISKP